MGDEALREALRELAEEVAEQFEYLRELGVGGVEFDAGAFAAPAPAEAPGVLYQTSAPKQPKAEPARTAALKRNAEADAGHARPRLTPPPPPSIIARERPVQAAPPAPERAEMAKRKTVREPDAQPPAPMETLFGEITPKDELSLPRPGETLEDIRKDIGLCMRCPLCCEGRSKVVHSEGNERARLMFVGEAPGADEDAQGRPFVGRAGQLLNKIIEAIGLKREDVFIGNVNRCRPANNRTPTAQEAATCKPFLLREIAIVRPEVIVVLGNTAMKNLLDTKEGITKLRGKFQDYKGIKVMPTFHPAYLLRDPSKKRETWDDMKTVRDYLSRTKAAR